MPVKFEEAQLIKKRDIIKNNGFFIIQIFLGDDAINEQIYFDVLICINRSLFDLALHNSYYLANY